MGIICHKQTIIVRSYYLTEKLKYCQGYINKEIADKLNISLSTVITHRRNIMEKLNAKSVSALTIYAVMQGFVDITNI